MASLCISITVVVNFMTDTQLPTSCVCLHAALQRIFVVFGFHPSPQWQRVIKDERAPIRQKIQAANLASTALHGSGPC